MEGRKKPRPTISPPTTQALPRRRGSRMNTRIIRRTDSPYTAAPRVQRTSAACAEMRLSAFNRNPGTPSKLRYPPNAAMLRAVFTCGGRRPAPTFVLMKDAKPKFCR
jgi:hypothetical protein